jgi:pimeloyl-ACP methyl ester carboxylesterase
MPSPSASDTSPCGFQSVARPNVGLERVESKDGTIIAYDRLGAGDPVILVGGASVDRSPLAGLAERLGERFAVYNYDRRGRGESVDTEPYAPEREVEDIAAVVAAVGGPAHLFGSSSGAALALLAAASGLPVRKLALWEPPFVLDYGTPRPSAPSAPVHRRLLEGGGDAVEFFMARAVGLPPEYAAQVRNSPAWAELEQARAQLAYDAEIMGDYSLPRQRAGQVTASTLVLWGDASFPFLAATAAACAHALPDGRALRLEGQSHVVDSDVLARVLAEFFAG